MNRPLLYYAIALLLGGLAYLISVENVILGAIFLAPFFIIIFFTLDKKFSILISIFAAIGIIAMYAYFNPNFSEKQFAINICQKKNEYIIGDYKDRKVIMKSVEKSREKLDVGMNVNLEGKFISEKVYEKGIVGRIQVKKIKCVNKGWIYNINKIKNNLFYNFKDKIGKDSSSFIMAICFGDTSYLSENQIYDFQKLGVIHAVSVSGFHLAVIYKIIESLGGIWFASILAFFYVIFTGFQPPAIRAFIMILIYKISKKVKMNYDGLSSISMSAIILYVWRPYYLLDIGFSLSFLATLGIILYYQKVQRTLYFIPKKINESVSITISAQIFSMPYVAFTLHTYSPDFFLGNFFLMPIYTMIVVIGNISALTVYVEPVFNLLTYFTSILMDICNKISQCILKITPDVMYFSTQQGIFLLLTFTVFILQKHDHKKSIFLPAAFFITMIAVNIFPQPIITHFNTYEGDNYVIDYKGEKMLLMSAEDYSGQDIKKLNTIFKPTKFIIVQNEGYEKKLDNNFYIKAAKQEPGTINLKVYYRGKYVSFNNCGHEVLKSKYDIIDTSSKRQNLRYLNFYNVDKLTKYKICYGKVIIMD